MSGYNNIMNLSIYDNILISAYTLHFDVWMRFQCLEMALQWQGIFFIIVRYKEMYRILWSYMLYIIVRNYHVVM